MMRRIAAFLLSCSACASPPTARYASWEPLRSDIPAVDAVVAKRRLAASRVLWQRLKTARFTEHVALGGYEPPADGSSYSYVRAAQRADDLVEFTLFGVERDRVALRALVRAHPDRLDQIWNDPDEREVRALWVERGTQVGTHEEGSPPRTIDQLYDECQRALDEHPGLRPTLYFHPHGLLMQCGFSDDQCDDCPGVSIQSYSRFSLALDLPSDDPVQWVCATAWGVYVPGSDIFEHHGVCYPAGRFRPPRKRRPARRAPPDEAMPCDLDPDACERPQLGDICTIDPRACYQHCGADDCRAAYFAH